MRASWRSCSSWGSLCALQTICLWRASCEWGNSQCFVSANNAVHIGPQFIMYCHLHNSWCTSARLTHRLEMTTQAAVVCCVLCPAASLLSAQSRTC
jgi:hypothetical protein